MSDSTAITIDDLLVRLAASPQPAILPLIQQYDPRASPASPDQLEDLNEALSQCLEVSTETGDLHTVEFLLSRWKVLTGSDTPDDDLLFSGLVAAAQNGHHEVVSCLLSHGAPLKPSIPGHVAANAPKEVDLREVFRVLIEQGGWDINDVSNKQRPALHYVVDRSDLLPAFLEWGADPNAVGHDGLTPLDAAAGRGPTLAFDQLLAAGATLADAYPLHQAVATSSAHAMEMMHHLLALGVDVNARLFENHPERAGLRQADEDFGTPLHCAARSGAKNRVMLLLEKGADASKRSSKGKSPLYWAQNARRPKIHPETLKLLEEVEKEVADGTSNNEK
jgi:ankyrin repeat protein